MASGLPVNRRLFLALCVASVPVGLAACGGRDPGPAPRPPGTEPQGSLQQTIDDMGSRGGGVVVVGADRVYVESGITLPTGVDLEVRGIVRRARGSTRPLITVTGTGCTIRGFPGGSLDGNRQEEPQESDVVRIRGARCTVTGVAVRDSPSNGIGIFSSSGNRVEGCQVVDSRNNGVIVANRGSDANLVINNHVEGTSEQNGIFVTASAGSTPTSDSVRDNQVIGNDVSGVGDTGIESGIHTVNTLVSGNTVVAARNPGILLRDCTGVQVTRNTVRTTGETVDAYAVVPQTQPPDVPISSVFTDCTVVGNARRAGFYINSGGVSIRGARLLPADPPTDARGGAVVTGAVNDIEVVGLVADGWQTGFVLNDASTEASLRNVRILDPRSSNVDYVYSAVGAHLIDCVLELGHVEDVSTALFQRNDVTSLEGSSRVVPPSPDSTVPSGVDTSLPSGPGGN